MGRAVVIAAYQPRTGPSLGCRLGRKRDIQPGRIPFETLTDHGERSSPAGKDHRHIIGPGVLPSAEFVGKTRRAQFVRQKSQTAPRIEDHRYAFVRIRLLQHRRTWKDAWRQRLEQLDIARIEAADHLVGHGRVSASCLGDCLIDNIRAEPHAYTVLALVGTLPEPVGQVFIWYHAIKLGGEFTVLLPIGQRANQNGRAPCEPVGQCLQLFAIAFRLIGLFRSVELVFDQQGQGLSGLRGRFDEYVDLPAIASAALAVQHGGGGEVIRQSRTLRHPLYEGQGYVQFLDQQQINVALGRMG